MTFTVGRRLGPNTRAPRGTPEGYIPRVSATGTIIEWVAPADIGIGTSPVTVDDGMGGFALVFDEDGNVVYA